MNNLYRVGGNGNPSDANQIIDAMRGENDVGAIQAYSKIDPPGALTAAIKTTTGNLNGDYQYKVAFITGYWKGPVGTGVLYAKGNTGGGTASNTVSPSGQQVNLSGIPIGGAGVVARAIYRTKAGGSTFYFLQQINDNVSTTWVDNIADSALTQAMPNTNTTGSYFSGDGRGLTNLQGVILPDGSVPMIGPLKLSGNPSDPLHAVPEQYVDSFVKNNPAPVPISLTNGQQIITTTKAGMMQNFKAFGRTLVNSIGHDGNCEDTSKWGDFQATHALDSSNYVYGSNSIKVTIAATYTAGAISHSFTALANKYYIALAKVKNGNASTGVDISGFGTVSTTISDTNNFQDVYIAFTKTSDTTNNINFDVSGVAGQYGYVDGVRVFEITQAEYNAIQAGSYTAAQLASKYPYVDDVKHLSGLYAIRYGENQLPTFIEATVSAGGGSTPTFTVSTPYSATLTAVQNLDKIILSVPALENQQYTLSLDAISAGGYIGVQALDASGNQIPPSPLGYTNALTATFTTPAGTKTLNVLFGNNTSGAGTYTFTNPRLNLGSADKGFKPRNDDMLIFPVSLASSVDGSVYDQIYHRDGRYWRENRFVKDMVLDGSLGWIFSANATGFKEVKVPITNAVSFTDKVVKYDGKILQSLSGGGGTAGDQCQLNATAGYLFIEVSSADSGWGDSYTPTNAEIQAYFYGWKMYVQGAFTYDPYNGTGTKGWVQIGWKDKNNDPNIGQHCSSTLPTTYAANSPYSPYKITYQLATPTFDDLTELMEGSVNFLEGPNQVEVGAGMILREKANPVLTNGIYFINDSGQTGSNLRNRANKIVGVYSNGRFDPKWTLSSSGTPNGLQKSITAQANFDPTATYEVTYQALDQYLLTTYPVTTITAEYDTNVKTVLDRIGQRVADNEQRLSVAEMLAAKTYGKANKSLQAITIYIDPANGSDSGDGSAAKPFKTWAKALAQIPPILNHSCNIYVAPGTSAEDVSISGISGSGSINVYGDTVASTSYTVTSFTVASSTASVYVRGLNANSTSLYGFGALYSTRVTFDYCNVTAADNVHAGVSNVGSFLTVSNGVFSNRVHGIFQNGPGVTYSNNNSGTGNIDGLYAGAGTIFTFGTQPSGTSGGLYASAAGGVINPWGDTTKAKRSHVAATHSSQSVSAATFTKVPYSTVATDNLSEFNSTTYRYTATVDETISIVGGLYFSSALPTGTFIAINTYKNGSSFHSVSAMNGSGVTGGIVNFTDVVDLNAGDYIEIYVYTSTATTLGSGGILEITRIA